MYVIKHIGIDFGVNPCVAGVDVMSGDKAVIRRESRLVQPLHKYAKGLKNSE
jgi:hypothetical protein